MGINFQQGSCMQASNDNRNILIIDDDDMALLFLKNGFEMGGFTPILCQSSLDAVSLYKKHCPVAVIIDIFMPDKDGIEILNEIKKMTPGILCISVSSNKSYLKTMDLLGADDTFSKDEPIEKIVEAVASRIAS